MEGHIALGMFVFAGLATPGPNVIMLLSSGVRFGFKATLPHVIGVAVGVGFVAGLAGLGIAAVLLGIPALAFAFKLLAAAWILYLAYRLLGSAKAPRDQSGSQPFTFVQAVLFQWVNPKIWAVALAAGAGYSSGMAIEAEALRLAITFSTLNLFVCLFYSASGGWLKPMLQNRQHWRLFLQFMAGLMALSALLIFL